MEFRILGSLEVFDGGRRLELGASKQRQLLAILLVRANEIVSVDRLTEDLWAGEPPATAGKGLQVHLSRLRKALGREDVIVTRGGGYCLVATDEEIDALWFEQLSTRGRDRLASGDVQGAVDDLRAALKLWRGPALAEFAYEPFAQAEISRLEELRLVALEDRIAAEIKLGLGGVLVPELEALVREHPLRERVRGQLMLALYRTGRQAEALEVYQKTRGILVEELGIEPSAELKVLEKRILAQDPMLLAPREPTAPPPGEMRIRTRSLPVPSTSLIGRERELAHCCELLRDERVRLLTLTGAGGIGKTRLGIGIATQVESEFRDGVFFIPLARLTDPDLVAGAIAQVLGVTETNEPMELRLRQFVSSRELLLLIDNFEQLLPAAPLLGELLEAAPDLKLVVTSRALLRLAGEHQYSVPPLDLPDPGRLPDVGALAGLSAVALFVERSRALNTTFELSEDNAQAIAEICLRLDGLPLALELAAARIRHLSPRELLARLEQRLPLLTGGVREAPARQQTLRATIDWSYDLLTKTEQTLFARLACFAGGCALQAAEDICAASLDDLGSLVDKSLLRERASVLGETRFEMLATVREYGFDRLEASGEGEDLHRRHAEHFVVLAEHAEPEILRADQTEWLERLNADRDNFRAALEWLLRRGEGEKALRLIASLRRAWVAQGYLTETRRWLEAALAQAEVVVPPVRAKAVYGLGRVRLAQGDYDEARDHLQEAVALSREIDDPEGLVFALADLGGIASAQGDHERAELLAREALAEARQAQNEMAIAAALHSLGSALLDGGDHRSARAVLAESLALRRARGDKRNVANSLATLGAAAFLERNYRHATELLDESLALGRELGNLLLVATALASLGLVALFEDDYDCAEALAAEALTLSRDIGDKWTIGECLHILAGVAAAREQDVRAGTLARAAESLHESIQAPPSRAEQAIRDRFLVVAQEWSGREPIDIGPAIGATLEPDDAIEYALHGARREKVELGSDRSQQVPHGAGKV
jgi:predicted ATPase/DNA-binding winged helix-turn-helix (wHTH) protein